MYKNQEVISKMVKEGLITLTGRTKAQGYGKYEAAKLNFQKMFYEDFEDPE